MQNNFVAMIIVALYMVILLAISWYSTKYLQKKDSASFLFAKKAMSWPLVAMIVSGCAIGGSATLGVAEKAYTHGISAAWWTMAWAFAAVFYGAVLARRVNRSRYETVNQMYGAVYGDKFLTVSVIVQILNMFVVNAASGLRGRRDTLFAASGVLQPEHRYHRLRGRVHGHHLHRRTMGGGAVEYRECRGHLCRHPLRRHTCAEQCRRR